MTTHIIAALIGGVIGSGVTLIVMCCCIISKREGNIERAIEQYAY